MKGSAIAVPLLFFGVDILLSKWELPGDVVQETMTSLGSRMEWDMAFIVVQDPHAVGV